MMHMSLLGQSVARGRSVSVSCYRSQPFIIATGMPVTGY